MLLGIIGLGYFTGQTEFFPLIAMYAGTWAAYVLLVRHVGSSNEVNFLMGFSILLRFLLLFSFPNLSDDIYRFIWDGHLVLNGQNPFNTLPKDFIGQGHHLPGISNDLYALLNSKEYYTIYPPVNQLTFLISAALAPDNWWLNAFILKVFLFGAEIGTLFLMKKILEHHGKPAKQLLWYGLNPLIILEITGNLHFEGMMIFFLLLSYWMLLKGKWWQSALFIGFSIGTKLLPLMFLPFYIRRLGWRKSLLYFVITGLTLLLLFFPLYNQVFIQNFSNSLNLYFRQFEFNASIYYIARWIGFQLKGYNLIARIGPWLAYLTLAIILSKTVFEKKPDLQNLPKSLLFAFSTYLFLSTTVHPWYISMPLALAVFTPYRFPILWSGFIMYTYIHYDQGRFYENYWVIGFEYALLFIYILVGIKPLTAIRAQ